MPSLKATPLPAFGWVRVVVDWSDTPGVTYARVERVNPATGEVTPLRPYTDYDGWYQRLSNGRAVLYDTEAPLDAPVYYRTDSLTEPGVSLTVAQRDDFNREPVVAGWGSAPDGTAWVVSGIASNYSVVGV